MTHDVFISYAYEDKSIADAICAKLEGNQIRCWIAPRDIAPGDKYASALIHAIDHSAVIVVIFSSKADKSPHVRTEIERAFNDEKIIIPFRIENIEPSDELQYFIGSRHWLDALTPPLEEHINNLIKVIQKNFEGNSDFKKNENDDNINITEERVPQKIENKKPLFLKTTTDDWIILIGAFIIAFIISLIGSISSGIWYAFFLYFFFYFGLFGAFFYFVIMIYERLQKFFHL